MSTSWFPLILATLQAQACKLGRYIAAGSWCEITHQQWVDVQVAEENAETRTASYLLLEITVTNLENASYGSGRFLVPSEAPRHNLSCYRAVYCNNFGHFQVSHRQYISQHQKDSVNDVSIEGTHSTNLGSTCGTARSNSAQISTADQTAITQNAIRSRTSTSDTVLPASDNGYYYSPTGEDWTSIIDDEEEEHALNAYHRFPTEQDWAGLDEEARSKSHTADTKHARDGLDAEAMTEAGFEDSFQLPNLRQYIPADTTTAFEEIVAQLDPDNRDTIAGRQYAQGVVDWQWMCEASEQLRASGQGYRPRFEEAHRPIDWFWTAMQEDDTKTTTDSPRSEPRATTIAPQSQQTLKPVHHINFSGEPVYERTYTAPAVSFWAAKSEGLVNRVHHNGSLLRSVISSNAGKMLDPFLAPDFAPQLKATKLKDWATGLVEVVYQTYGTWMSDKLEPGDDQRIADGPCSFFGCGDVNHPPQPYIIGPCDGDVVINDDGRTHLAKVSKKRACVGLPSILSQMEKIEDIMAVNEYLTSASVKNSYTIPPDAFAALFNKNKSIVSINTLTSVHEADIETDKADDLPSCAEEPLSDENDDTSFSAVSDDERLTPPPVDPQDVFDFIKDATLDPLLSSDESSTDSDHYESSFSMLDTNSTGSSVSGGMGESYWPENLFSDSVPNIASFSQPSRAKINKGICTADAMQLDNTITQAEFNCVRILNEHLAMLPQPVPYVQQSIIDQPFSGTQDVEDEDRDFDYQSDDELEIRDSDSEDSWSSNLEADADVKMHMHESLYDSLISPAEVSIEATSQSDKNSLHDYETFPKTNHSGCVLMEEEGLEGNLINAASKTENTLTQLQDSEGGAKLSPGSGLMLPIHICSEETMSSVFLVDEAVTITRETQAAKGLTIHLDASKNTSIEQEVVESTAQIEDEIHISSQTPTATSEEVLQEEAVAHIDFDCGVGLIFFRILPGLRRYDGLPDVMN